jgi:hypothetical protein
MKMTPPWSRRRDTQPVNVTVCPAFSARSDPAKWVRSTVFLSKLTEVVSCNILRRRHSAENAPARGMLVE